MSTFMTCVPITYVRRGATGFYCALCKDRTGMKLIRGLQWNRLRSLIVGGFRGVVVHSKMPIFRVRCTQLVSKAQGRSSAAARPDLLPHSHTGQPRSHPQLHNSQTFTITMFCECLIHYSYSAPTDMRCSLLTYHLYVRTNRHAQRVP